MAQPISFEMTIEAIFHLLDRTAFAGFIEGYEGLIQPCKAELLLDEKVWKTIEISEELFDRRHPLGQRGVSTFDPIDWNDETVKKHECKLRSICRSNN
ncbi:MAG: hypothetical protein SXA11_02495 [Cyanobacteriota bacterium]|nr:hypothetical protein [Cyanobacteriota bacterium]